VWSTRARIVVGRPEALSAAYERTVALLSDVDRAASRFRDDSEIAALEAAAGAQTRVSALLGELLAASLEAARETDGDVDPCLAHSMRELGYDRDFALLPGLEAGRLPMPSLRPASSEALATDGGHQVLVTRPLGWRDVRLGDGTVTVPAGLGLDLGATAKAFASDLVAATVTAELGTGILVSLGGDIATAGPGPDGGWRILVSDGPGQPEASIALPAGSAVATSSTIRRRWTHAGQQVHHILDPRTGRPAPPVWRTVTVAAHSCVRANTLTTAAVVRGHRAPAWLRSQGVAARLVAEDGTVARLGGWPEGGADQPRSK
jgi:thiamine biosynthesis lipoprotein